jgi:transposase
MNQIKNILRTYQAKQSIKATASTLKVSKNTVRHYLRRAEAHSPDLNVVLELSDDELRKILYPDKTGAVADRKLVFEGKVDYWIRELGRRHVTRQTLFEEYRLEYPDGYAQTQFYDYLSRAIGRRDLTLALKHEAGKTMQLDYAGKPLEWVDRETGEVRYAQVLLAAMPHSQHTYAIALPSQCTVDFVHGINEALCFFGGLPKVVLSDNLKAFVIRADRYEPDFNDVCVQLANHYQVDLQATRVASPKDKASVEGAVRVAYGQIYAPLRNHTFYSIEEINAAIRQQLHVLQDRPFQKRPGCRREIFQTYELPEMRPLPSEPFLLKSTVRAKVQRNYHVHLGERKNFYSVPFQHVGDKATVIYSRATVEVFIGPNRVATHARLSASHRYRYQTDPAHLPKNHEEWRKAEGYNGAYFRNWARKIGPATEWAISKVLQTKIHESQTYRSCQGVLALAKVYGDDRLENAALRCQTAGQATYNMLKNILEKSLDLQASQPDLFTPPAHENIRGPQAYQ